MTTVPYVALFQKLFRYSVVGLEIVANPFPLPNGYITVSSKLSS